MYPKVIIDPKKYAFNVDYITNLCHRQQLSVMAVSKVFSNDPKLIEVLDRSNVSYIADSKLENLMHMKTTKKKVYLRIPALSEASLVVRYTDMSLNSELVVIDKLNEVAAKMNKRHQIIFMYDLGDLREGVYYKDFSLKDIKHILSLSHIELKGIGTNLTCYGSVIPTFETYEKLKNIKDQIESNFKIKLDIISGGNSSSIPMLMNQTLPPYINNLRIGEALILGRETAYQEKIDHLYEDVITLEVEILEIKDKPSFPEGELGYDAFGQKIEYVDKGMMKRAILGIGRQDVSLNDLYPIKGITFIGSSSDHLIVEIAEGKYHIGDILTFKLKYGGILSLLNSSYVEKTYV
ncbi:alanine/ornithine racemase family PLP-dependent enzyme [Mariniplasma anaerobium]|uniref:Alanine racemase n=1 Tax=Mariniplasma anaerobium TaxID=2735436 RepID=A0A7U9TLJ9_9MOLU|nr:alanine/ornithine racemase family PLP-dependent enzyme [Mariniplasma anaerobium]BCR35969.1 alanine racemase [Mariniplasma anaerobium]